MKLGKYRSLVFVFLSIVMVALVFLSEEKTVNEDLNDVEEMNLTKLKDVSITTVYDNYQHKTDLQSGWGLSCLVEAKNQKILFDTGEDSESLLDNIDTVGIDLKGIDAVFLSHRHWDHVGGLEGFLEENSDVTVYLLESFPETVKSKVRESGANLAEVEGSEKITTGVGSTGPLRGPPEEQSLIVSTDKGLVVITGCAHPGVVRIVERAKKLTGENVYLVIGGFHLGSASEREIREIADSFKEMGVEKVAPSHCSGDRARELFEKEYGEDYIENGAGKEIEI